MQIEELIGRRIQALRKTMKDGEIVTQEDLGERMGTYLEKPWSRQAVSAAEKGQRSFTAVELAAFASIFEVPVQSLFQAPIDVVYLDMPSGVSVDVRNLRRGRGMVTEVGSRSKGGLDEVVEKFREAAAEMQGSWTLRTKPVVCLRLAMKQRWRSSRVAMRRLDQGHEGLGLQALQVSSRT